MCSLAHAIKDRAVSELRRAERVLGGSSVVGVGMSVGAVSLNVCPGFVPELGARRSASPAPGVSASPPERDLWP